MAEVTEPDYGETEIETPKPSSAPSQKTELTSSTSSIASNTTASAAVCFLYLWSSNEMLKTRFSNLARVLSFFLISWSLTGIYGTITTIFIIGIFETTS